MICWLGLASEGEELGLRSRSWSPLENVVVLGSSDAVADLLATVDAGHVGGPQDLEWCVSGGKMRDA